ncbi:MAG: FliH/SctL family protein [Pyrinomonadaceae bacterium]
MSVRLIKGVEELGQQAYAQFMPPQALQAATASPFFTPGQQKARRACTRVIRSRPRNLFWPPPVAGAAALLAPISDCVVADENASPDGDDNAAIIPQMMMQQGEERAEQIVAQALAQAEAIERAAEERGLAALAATVAAETAQAVEPLRQKLTETLDELMRLRAAIALRAERDLVRLSLEIAKKIVRREVTIDHEIALTLARVALARIHNRAVATVHLHPEDYSFVALHRDKFDGNCSIELAEDRSIERGGCLVSTEMGDIDARIENQFAEIESGLLGL